MSLRLPDFIIGGAPRSGTTWLYRLLDLHPAIEMAKPVQPEPKFFLVDEQYERGLPHYASTWFAQIPFAKKAGEKSTNYLESATAAARIHRHLPDVRLIFMLREPAARALSNWRWSRMNGVESLTFEDALDQETAREATYPPEWRYARPHSYFSRGLYRRMLQPYVDLFGLDHILCQRYEDISDNPARLATSVHGFLEVEPREADSVTLGTVNPSNPEAIEQETLVNLRRRYEQPNRELKDLLGSRIDLWET